MLQGLDNFPVATAHFNAIFYIGYGAETNDLILEDQNGCIRGCEEFEYLGSKSR